MRYMQPRSRSQQVGIIGSWVSRLPLRGTVTTIPVVGLVIVLGLFYVVQINSLATKGYQIKELENKLTALEEESQTLASQQSELQSLQTVQNKVADLEMVAVDQVQYLQRQPVARANQ